MPASWLVTRPPRPMSRNVATAFNTANQNSAGRGFLFMLRNRTTAAAFRTAVADERILLEKLFHLEREVLRCAVGFHFNIGVLCAEFAVCGFERVFARWNIFNGEFPVFA